MPNEGDWVEVICCQEAFAAASPAPETFIQMGADSGGFWINHRRRQSSLSSWKAGFKWHVRLSLPPSCHSKMCRAKWTLLGWLKQWLWRLPLRPAVPLCPGASASFTARARGQGAELSSSAQRLPSRCAAPYKGTTMAFNTGGVNRLLVHAKWGST